MSHKSAIVTILDATTKMGKHLAMLLKQNPLIDELRLYDKDSKVCSLAEDLSHIDTKTNIKSFWSNEILKYAVANANVVVSLGSCRASPSETVEQTLEKNLHDVTNAVLHLIEFNPDAIFCIANPPVEIFVPLACEEYRKANIYDTRNIIGVATLQSMRANAHIAAFRRQPASEVYCPIVGGVGPDCLLCNLSQATPPGLTLPKNIQKKIANSENDLLKLYGGCDTVCLTPALATSRLVDTLLKGLRGDNDCVDCAFIKQIGHIENFLPYMTSIVRFGRHGVMSSHMPHLSGEEVYFLKKISHTIRKYISIGEELASGYKLNPKNTDDNSNTHIQRTTPQDCSTPVLKCHT